MPYTPTPTIGLKKSNKGDGEKFSQNILGQNWDAIDAAILFDRAQLAAKIAEVNAKFTTLTDYVPIISGFSTGSGAVSGTAPGRKYAKFSVANKVCRVELAYVFGNTGLSFTDAYIGIPAAAPFSPLYAAATGDGTINPYGILHSTGTYVDVGDGADGIAGRYAMNATWAADKGVRLVFPRKRGDTNDLAYGAGMPTSAGVPGPGDSLRLVFEYMTA